VTPSGSDDRGGAGALEAAAPGGPTHDDSLIERARSQWQAGQWESITRLDAKTIERHPDRAKLALIVASAWQQLNDHQAARRFVKLALEWGCDRKLVARVLIAGVHNTLALAEALRDDAQSALTHFRAAVAGGGGNVSFASGIRAASELKRLGFSMSLDGGRLSLGRPALPGGSNVAAAPGLKAAVPHNVESLRFYENLAGQIPAGATPRFVLLDVKSLPRSGLHYLKSVLARVLREDFSFCEWYMEPGCCKRMPCALTGFASEAQRQDHLRVRMTKSHDFQLSDPAYPVNRVVQRIILVRDPLFALTSYFALDQLGQYEQKLKEAGIALPKIWLSHEPEVAAMAYEVMDRNFVALPAEALSNWLRQKTEYFVGFLDKWLGAESAGASVVSYDHVDEFATGFLAGLRDAAAPELQRRIDERAASVQNKFRARSDPYAVSSQCLSAYLTANSRAFVEAANEIRSRAPGLLLKVLENQPRQ